MPKKTNNNNITLKKENIKGLLQEGKKLNLSWKLKDYTLNLLAQQTPYKITAYLDITTKEE